MGVAGEPAKPFAQPRLATRFERGSRAHAPMSGAPGAQMFWVTIGAIVLLWAVDRQFARY